MNFSRVLNRYLSRRYILNMLLILLVLLGIVYLFETVELLRRAAKKDDVPFALVLEMGFLKLPNVGQMLFPFAILFSAMFTFWQLTRRHELVVVRAAGFSAWQFLAPVIGIAVFIGFLNITVVNTAGSALLNRFDALESKYLSQKKSYVALLREGLWLRQIDDDGKDYVILHAGRVDLSAWKLRDVTLMFFDGEDRFTRRIDAREARLADGQWHFENATDNVPGQPGPRYSPREILPTTLTTKELEESFASPAVLSIWQFPGFIKTMENTGFDATPVKIRFQTLLAQPLLFAAMILLAATVSMRPPRLGGTMPLIAAGVVIGLVVFFMASFLEALGASHRIPVFLAAWSPALVTSLLGIAAILNLEDG